MAHKKAGGSASTNRDSQSKRLGVKKYGEENVISGNIVIRQKGSHFYPGVGTKKGNDYTIYAITSGKVRFVTKQGRQLVEVR
ncbi:50S ribosomal protein L27 [Candidatus Daviesbacteria bacterium RIFCSPLOWO2_02_FULL_40_8]|uniref:Large ribosomal subunit protein bL27 n=1 Tax=Candidatus Daviesbacteria bacterium RIFCSPLOWO2_01_FULL_40_24 TaxID=1797787 RepID=A0A1F5MJ41_9BACT|nr:MAG: 50S ribosomal protein L27 [Candidatus Daviesbacteria bacterium RIFCSPHIGHO2_01_FULL_41_45]OGE34479.1 MAG: 50S ribosomal protein L27 [Candidatus Daviesbacteria bacterium RIFCSPHIGHO2_02_FULL_41_14]OGE65391.1 MAG: 50S ribosomal protein L27 [Candidatus Daviesbacteria bacterium RIFCSPLOWO2_01_FULL_40_24]OGE65910.1 MAG: 50S ribosomal protein L27 [Candidatus Daviesbacteria bacterium RIFCSPLOWO2_02_FULL_40_8]